jgi:PKD repeat protein
MVALGSADISIHNTGEKMKKQKLILIIALVALVSCMIVSPVSAISGWYTASCHASGGEALDVTFDHPLSCDPYSDCYNLTPQINETVYYTSEWLQNPVGSWQAYINLFTPTYYTDHSEPSGSFKFTGYDINNRGTPAGSIGLWPEWGDTYFCPLSDFYVQTTEYVNPIPVASFACTPTLQNPDANIVCTDTSTNTPTSWLWSIDMEGAGIMGWQTHTGQNFTWQSHYPGLYSVNLRVNNTGGSDWENKTNYVSISLNATPNNCNLPVANGYIRTYAQTNDGMTSGGIYGSQIQMRDMEGGAWSNTTSSEGYWCIDTLPGHTLNLYAQATGYTSTTQLGVSANGGRYYLVLWPDYISAPSAGNVSLYVLVYDQQTGSPLYLSSVRVDGNSINTILKNTGPEGQASFTIKNNTAIHVTASKTGYNTITRTMTTSHLGPDTLMISLPRATVTPTLTATTGPGGTVAPTVAPGKNADGTYQAGYTNMQGQEMMNWLAENGMALVQLCFLVTVFALLGIKFGK